MTAETAVAPAPLMEGSFALYRHNDGFVVAWRKRGAEQPHHLSVPAFVLQMAASASGKSVDEIIHELIGDPQ